MADQDTSVFDAQQSLRRLMGKEALLRKIVVMFLDQHQDHLAKIETAVESGVAKDICATAHAFKGAIANFVAPLAFQAALRLEKIGKSEEIVRVVRRSCKTSDGHIVNEDERGIELSYPLDDKNITVEVARTGDITDRKRAETELQFHNALLQAQQEATIDGIVVVNEKREWVSYNKQFMQMWGIPLEMDALRIAEKNLVDVGAFWARLEYLYDHQDEIGRDELNLIDGRVFDRYSAPLFGPNGRYFGRIWRFNDVTAYKRIEEALRKSNDELESRVIERTAALQESEERFLQLAERIHEGFYVVSLPERQSLYFSPSCETIFGTSVETLYENPMAFNDVVLEKDRMELDSVLEQQKEGIATQIEYRLVDKDGAVRWIWDQAFPVKDTKGNVYRVVGIAEDVTAQKVMGEQLLQAQKMDAVGQLAGGVAHDFNNLLTVINGYSKLALRKLDADTPTYAHIEEIRDAGGRARGLIRQLLAFSRKQMLMWC